MTFHEIRAALRSRSRAIPKPNATFLWAALFCFLTFPAVVRAAEKAKTLKFEGLSAPATIVYDSYGIPHIDAATDRDAWFLAGWAQARDRLVQMEMSRRIALGRLSEILGESYLQNDIDKIETGLPASCLTSWEAAPPASREALTAFADGVNFYLKTMKSSDHPEFALFGIKPRPWSPVDSVAIGRQMSWNLSQDLGNELGQGRVFNELGPALYYETTLFQGLTSLSIIEWKEMKSKLSLMDGPKIDRLARVHAGETKGGMDPLVGSNNWVVGSNKSSSGRPLLANDPHLALMNPSIWYEMHLKTPEMDVMGTTFPGSPVVLVGHNRRIAWGVTTAGYDVTDIYLETPDPRRPSERYLHKGESLPYEVEAIEIPYRQGGKSAVHKLELRRTVHGPVVAFEPEQNRVVSFRWTGHEPSFEMESFLRINKAQNLTEFKEALKYFDVGAQSFVYADTDGDVYYQSAGKVPIRKGVPYLPMDGASGEHEWTGYIPRDELPQLTNPERGYVATANNIPAGPDYPYYIGVFFSEGLRAKAITDRLTAKAKISSADMKSIQADVRSVLAETFLPAMLSDVKTAGLPGHPAAKTALEALREWDYEARADSVACSVFHKWLKHLVLKTFDDEAAPVKRELEGLYKQMFLADPSLSAYWFDDRRTPAAETRADTVKTALQAALEELSDMFGPRTSHWTWGKLHQLTVRNYADPSKSFGPFAQDGALGTVDIGNFDLLGKTYEYSGGPSLRFVAEMKPDRIDAWNVIPGGQRYDPKSKHYKDQLDLWLNNRYRPMIYYPEDLKKSTEMTLDCQPAPPTEP